MLKFNIVNAATFDLTITGDFHSWISRSGILRLADNRCSSLVLLAK